MNEPDKCPHCGAEAVYRDVEIMSMQHPVYGSEFDGWKCGTFDGERTIACFENELSQLRQFKRIVLANVKRQDQQVTLDKFIQFECGHMAVCEFFVGRVHQEDVTDAFEHAVKFKAESECG